MRLINGDRLYDKMMSTPTELHYPSWYGGMVKDMPTVDPVKHGRWLYQGKNIWYKCSRCGHQAVGKLPYCGNCGAAMYEVTE